MSIHMHAMDNDWVLKAKQKKEFREYIDNGNPWACDQLVTDTRMQKIKQRYTVSEPYPSDDEIQKETRANKILLRDQKMRKDEIGLRYWQYEGYVHGYVADVISRQVIVQRMKQQEKDDDFGALSQLLKNVECSMLHTSKWLNAVRNSGEEHFLLLDHDNHMGNWKYSVYRNTSNQGIQTALWKWYGLEKVLLNYWREHYIRACDEWPNADPISMAIIRDQLYKGFEKGYYYNYLICGNEYLYYNKTTQYIGDPICRLKFKGQASCDWPYEKLEKLLAFAQEEANELNTELLWQAEEIFWKKYEEQSAEMQRWWNKDFFKGPFNEE